MRGLGTADRSALAVGGLQPGDVELHHLQHRLHDPLRLGGIGIAQQLRQYARHDLPRDAVAVPEPAASLDRTAGRQRVPQPVDLRLIGAGRS